MKHIIVEEIDSPEPIESQDNEESKLEKMFFSGDNTIEGEGLISFQTSAMTKA